MLHCDWSVAGRLMRQMSLTCAHHATVVGPIRFSNRSNNCRVCKINGRRSSLVRTHHATIVFSSSLRPTEGKHRMVCAGLYVSIMKTLYFCGCRYERCFYDIRNVGVQVCTIAMHVADNYDVINCFALDVALNRYRNKHILLRAYLLF